MCCKFADTFCVKSLGPTVARYCTEYELHFSLDVGDFDLTQLPIVSYF